ncbi:dihydrolipoyllysine-residue acetyltransferase [Uliginosibacterium sp. 31-16]|uniref:dihydrolipoyllysine-residue acetyltransferase n=1 Tax=Uliginosibacterium sp. 31-16 TaxID=3068315 RepID=UPI00273D0F93|nr:dihydrolipoyllysine-residue acetyltransferase [Uliginosibacterium sp. 31-16]MDP5241022.1 dihydrolipoyllysine-residue acetyltransferase [Uliginosibacterium sp. 31-16]
MSQLIEVKVPDIGDFKDVPVIEVFVKVGDTVKLDDPLLTLESDKATMEVPSSAAGVVKEVKVKIGERVGEGAVVVVLEAAGVAAAPAPAPAVAAPAPVAAPVAAAPVAAPAAVGRIELKVPDIGDFKDVPVIELFIKVGDTIAVDAPVATLESDKATMEVPSSAAGVVKEVLVKVGQRVAEGAVLAILEGAATAASPASVAAAAPAAAPVAAVTATAAPTPAAPASTGALAAGPVATASAAQSHASPGVRRFARELGVDITKVAATGPKGRILQDDVQNFVKGILAQVSSGALAPAGSAPAAGSGVGGLNLLPWPKVDFSKFGGIETQPLSRIKKISGANLHRNWVVIPHVTNHDDADITELEAFRVQMNKELEKSGAKLTMLAFMIKAAVAALKKFPEFNASLDGDNLVLKKYFHIGFAADTPNGLVVPVIRDADKKGVIEIAKEMGDLAKLARDGKLKPDQMQGGCFSISSLGGIGGVYFTPIINAPEVAIMGVCKSQIRPVWDGKQFAPRLMLPLSLSWDHRVIDGAAAARFNAYFAGVLQDFRRVLL